MSHDDNWCRMTAMYKKPNIFEYLDYRLFLKDLFAFKKEQTFGFSFRSLSRLAGFKSSNFLKFVLDEKRNLSTQGTLKLISALKLSNEESRFFETLVLFTQAKTNGEKNIYFERIAQFKNYTAVKQIDAQQYCYFSNWHYVALHELVLLKDFKESPNWINKKLKTNLSRMEIKRAIEGLLTLNLLMRDEQQRLRQTDQMLVVKPSIASLSITNFQKTMMSKASEALEKLPAEQREIASLTVAVSRKTFEKIRERLVQIRRELHALATEDNNPEAVAQLNMQLFTLSEVLWK